MHTCPRMKTCERCARASSKPAGQKEGKEGRVERGPTAMTLSLPFDGYNPHFIARHIKMPTQTTVRGPYYTPAHTFHDIED